MPDLSHQWGADLSVGPSGDLAVVTGSTLGQQRVLRRLLTNPGEYIWQTTYGAGLPGLIGQTVSAAGLRAVVRSQIFKEAAVARTPEPVIDVQPAGTSDGAYVHIRYVDAPSGLSTVLSLTVGA
jgi:phage baseplate assembly protein W